MAAEKYARATTRAEQLLDENNQYTKINFKTENIMNHNNNKIMEANTTCKALVLYTPLALDVSQILMNALAEERSKEIKMNFPALNIIYPENNNNNNNNNNENENIEMNDNNKEAAKVAPKKRKAPKKKSPAKKQQKNKKTKPAPKKTQNKGKTNHNNKKTKIITEAKIEKVEKMEKPKSVEPLLFQESISDVIGDILGESNIGITKEKIKHVVQKLDGKSENNETEKSNKNKKTNKKKAPAKRRTAVKKSAKKGKKSVKKNKK